MGLTSPIFSLIVYSRQGKERMKERRVERKGKEGKKKTGGEERKGDQGASFVFVFSYDGKRKRRRGNRILQPDINKSGCLLFDVVM